ncbi:CocE/NonD family hydrolase [Gemmatimonadota bacterium]
MRTVPTVRPAVGLLAILFLGGIGGCEHDPTILNRHEIDTGYALGISSSSLYVEMDDGIRIAVDVHLPEGIGDGPFPTILELTRYWRDRGEGLSYLVRRAVERGFAYVIMDERGTGASFGMWPYPLSERAVEDGRRVIDWIIDQSWSNGLVGSTGVSYPGMAAQQLAALGHPALRAIVPMSDTYDQYENLIFPGGVFNEAFIKGWSDIVYQMDRVQVLEFDDGVFRLSPVDSDQSGSLLSEAQAQHAGNLHAHEAMEGNLFRDDPVIPGVTLDDISTHSDVGGLDQSEAAVYHWGSWLDGGSADGVIRQFMETTGPQRAVIGAWNHGLDDNTSPFMQAGTGAIPSVQAQWEEALNFFDDLLKKGKPLQGRVFRYMTLNTGEWKSTSAWPIAGTEMERFYLSEGGRLSNSAPSTEEGEDTYLVSFEARSSDDSRWLSPLFGTTWYGNRRYEDDDLLVYETLPLTEDLEVTGYPVAHFHVSSTHSDGAFFVYLEDVDRWGQVKYVTEGILRGIHRKVSEDPGTWKRPIPYHSYRSEDAQPLVPGEMAELAFGLHPTSMVFGAGHRIRIAIAGHDASAFRRVPAEGTPEVRVQRNSVYPSYIELPVIRQ